jgi:hypothetical protein
MASIIGVIGGKLIGDLLGKISSSSSSAPQYQRSPEYNEFLQKLRSMLPSGQYNDPYANLAQNYYSNVMGDNYQAYSKEDLNRMYNQQAKDITQNIIQPQEEKLAARLALSGLSGGGTAGSAWDAQSTSNKKLLSDLYNNLQNMNLEATRADRSQAFTMTPALSSMWLSPLYAYGNYLSGANTAKNDQAYNAYITNLAQQNAQSEAWGKVLGGIDWSQIFKK